MNRKGSVHVLLVKLVLSPQKQPIATLIFVQIYMNSMMKRRSVLVIEIPACRIGKVFKFEFIPLMRVGSMFFAILISQICRKQQDYSLVNTDRHTQIVIIHFFNPRQSQKTFFPQNICSFQIYFVILRHENMNIKYNIKIYQIRNRQETGKSKKNGAP